MKSLNVPVLFVTFARPEYAIKTFQAIRRAKPKRFYFYSDKARKDDIDELDRNEKVRSLINLIDWECDLKTYFRDEHSGNIDISLWSAYDWIFDNEEEAIILEEDCVPSLAFFDFCEQLLNRYRQDQRVWVISGNNFNFGYNPNEYDYFFSYFPYLYGWASWRDRWKKVNRGKIPLADIEAYKLLNQIYIKPAAVKQALNYIKKRVDSPCWDFRFTLSMKCNSGIGIIPKINLVTNIGLIGVHSEGRKSIFHKREIPDEDYYEIKKTPPFVVSDYGYSLHWYKVHYLKKNKILYKLKSRLLRILNK